jgi:hypothetical protein
VPVTSTLTGSLWLYRVKMIAQRELLHIWTASLMYGLWALRWADGYYDLTMMMVLPDSAGGASRVHLHAYKAYSERRI